MVAFHIVIFASPLKSVWHFTRSACYCPAVATESHLSRDWLFNWRVALLAWWWCSKCAVLCCSKKNNSLNWNAFIEESVFMANGNTTTIMSTVWWLQSMTNLWAPHLAASMFHSCCYCTLGSSGILLQTSGFNFVRTFYNPKGKCLPFLKLTPTLGKIAQAVTNIHMDWVDFGQCQEFWCQSSSYVFEGKLPVWL